MYTIKDPDKQPSKMETVHQEINQTCPQLSMNCSNNHTTPLAPNVVTHNEGEWGSEEREILVDGKQEKLFLQSSLTRDEGT